jgi:hypothetical protein
VKVTPTPAHKVSYRPPTGRSRRFVRAARWYRTIEIQRGTRTNTAADPYPRIFKPSSTESANSSQH